MNTNRSVLPPPSHGRCETVQILHRSCVFLKYCAGLVTQLVTLFSTVSTQARKLWRKHILEADCGQFPIFHAPLQQRSLLLTHAATEGDSEMRSRAARKLWPPSRGYKESLRGRGLNFTKSVTRRKGFLPGRDRPARPFMKDTH